MKRNVIHFLQKRGFIQEVSSEHLAEAAMRGDIKGYIGFDPTADSLHLGHLVGIMALGWLEHFGNRAIAILGGTTAKIGDPSGKSCERPQLSDEAVRHNTFCIEKQLQRMLRSPAILNNEEWLSRFSLVDFLRDVGRDLRMGPMLAKESVKSRLHSQAGLSFTEFSYQALQAYDFYHLFSKEGVQLQMGGSDQWGNITAGIEMIRKQMGGREGYGAVYPLLTKSDGTKFGKSEGGAIWLDSEKTSPYQFYQHLLRSSDADVIHLMKMLTFMEDEEITFYETQIKKGRGAPNEAQRRFAEGVTLFVHGEEGLRRARAITQVLAPGFDANLNLATLEALTHDLPPICLPYASAIGRPYVEVVVESALLKSKGEGVRLIENGGAYLNNKRVEESHLTLERSHLIGGKFLLIGLGRKRKFLFQIEKAVD